MKWKQIGQRKFDRIIEALVHRTYDATARVEAVNGRGGDGGIDIKVTHGSKVRIFQLKYYLDGFPTTAYKGRRDSIKQSFARAMEHQPWEWILVVPCTLTPPEREFVTSLAAGHKVRIEVWNRPKLDGLLATHADLEAYFIRKQLFEAAKVYGQERALLMDGARDVSARVAALGRQADGLDARSRPPPAGRRPGCTIEKTARAHSSCGPASTSYRTRSTTASPPRDGHRRMQSHRGVRSSASARCCCPNLPRRRVAAW
ncbi:hypothetical protein [Streptomyces sp. 2131.1]|uniref:hypothetical protein n=1 Tax=Streptomyces sp. 2131.1 TaxID=1855346 RepID=UPI0015A4647D|nr:hypothetical protein [Streptomyces sp. 2131.1]